MLLDHIKDYDWIVWIDSDAYFYYDSPRLENLINHYNFKNTSSLLSFNIKQYQTGLKKYNINNGLFILKNAAQNISILNKVINCDDIYKIANEKHYIYDQSVFRYLYEINYENFKDNSVVLKYGVLQHFYDYELKYLKYKPYAHHMAGSHQVKNRESHIKWYYYKILFNPYYYF